MRKTTYSILKMDCPSEEQLIRMKLEGLSYIKSLNFDIPGRKLVVVHNTGENEISDKINSLDLDSSIVDSVDIDELPEEDQTYIERRLLWIVLGINFFFFLFELLSGFLAASMGLIADSIDMLADSFVYGLALFAVGGTIILKKKIAKISGYFQLILAIIGFAEVIRRFTASDLHPEFRTMVVVSILALAGNAACLWLLQKSRSREAHMRASMIFTSNDIIANLGVIVAGIVVYLTNSIYPDLIIGIAVFMLVARGALRILKLSD